MWGGHSATTLYVCVRAGTRANKPAHKHIHTSHTPLLAHGPLRLGFPPDGHKVQAAQHAVNHEDGVGALPVCLCWCFGWGGQFLKGRDVNGLVVGKGCVSISNQSIL